MAAQDMFNHHAQVCFGAIAHRPINRGIPAHRLDQFSDDGP